MRLPQVMLASLMSRDGTETSLARCLASNGLPAVHPIRDRSQLGDLRGSLCVRSVTSLSITDRLHGLRKLRASRFVPDRLHDKMTPIGDIRKAATMRIHSPSDLGALIRDRRTKMGLDQISLARRAGTSRKWLVEVEQGKPRAAIGLILRTLQALGTSLEVHESKDTRASRDSRRPIPAVDINQHLERLRRKP
jgi:HTH-type transcriptional regulator/antitoxin HipB